jgi:hypothetical protein
MFYYSLYFSFNIIEAQNCLSTAGSIQQPHIAPDVDHKTMDIQIVQRLDIFGEGNGKFLVAIYLIFPCREMAIH